MQVLADDGVSIHARVDGASSTSAVVLIAGFPLSHEIWAAQANALSSAHRVVCPDLRGLGSSGVPDGPYLMETLAADVATVLDRLGIDRVAIVGHSLGGYVAMAFARMFCERVTRIALVCSTLSADTPVRASERRLLADRLERDGSARALVDAYLPRLFAADAYERAPEMVAATRASIEKVEPRGAAALLRGMAVRVSSEDVAEDIGVPMMAIAGARDRLGSPDAASAAASRFPDGRLFVCQRSGHVPMLEEPSELTSVLEGLLR